VRICVSCLEDSTKKNVIAPQKVRILCLYCNVVYAKVAKFKHKKACDIMVKFHVVCLHPALVWFDFMVFNATFNNISVISWRSVLLVEEIRVPGENHRLAASH
jgi:hypothetical protein